MRVAYAASALQPAEVLKLSCLTCSCLTPADSGCHQVFKASMECCLYGTLGFTLNQLEKRKLKMGDPTYEISVLNMETVKLAKQHGKKPTNLLVLSLRENLKQLR